MQERFLILGCQRTGTTLMRLILETHPEVFCYDELKGYKVLSQPLTEEPPPSRLVGFKLPRWTEQFTQQILFDDGLDAPCENFYAGEKILFVLRDVRDTISSMIKLKTGETSWCQIWVPRIIRTKLALDEAFRARYAAEMDIVENCENQLIALAALYWKYKTDAFFEYRELGMPLLAVPYELLVTNPKPILEDVCRHLGIPFHENLLRHHQFEHAEVFQNGLTLGDTDPKRPMQLDSVGQWPQFLSAADMEVISLISSDLAAKVAALCESVSTATADLS